MGQPSPQACDSRDRVLAHLAAKYREAAAVTVTTPLTPAIVIGNRTANQVIITVDYLHVQANR